MTVWDTGWASRFAGTTAEAAIDVRLERRIVERERAFQRGLHEQYAAARAVVLVLEGEIRRTALETEAAMHAGVDTTAHRGERRAGKRAGCRTRRL